MQRESMDFDVVIVGAGPAGLTASIRLAQLFEQNNEPHNICVIDKGEEVGAHILSGAVLEPRALDELLPEWKNLEPPMHTAVTQDNFVFLTKTKHFKLPTPPQMNNHGNYIISLGQFCRWLANIAESKGVNIFPSFAATDILYDGDKVVGIITGDKGVDKHGKPLPNFQAGIELRAKQVILAEGCRGSLTQRLFKRFDLRKDVDPQTYGLGIKEIWEIPQDLHQAGKVTHTIGYPLDNNTYGGSFAYHFGENLLSIGFVVGLDYRNPYLNPYEEFQRFKMHPHFYSLLAKSKRIAYGARTLVEGGLQSLPKLTFPGGLIIGDAAGFLNVPKIKGIHCAMKSAMLAADSLYPLLKKNDSHECVDYSTQFKKSWLHDELYKARNIRPALRWGLFPGLAYAAVDSYVFRGHAPWTFHHKMPDNQELKKSAQVKKITYPKHDGIVTFDLPSSVYLTNIRSEENQPCHLHVKSEKVEIDVNIKEYAAPETRYCPAGVYEVLHNENDKPHLQINGANCIQCKACDIKDPTQNIVWTPPEGGSGPMYEMM